MAQDIRDMFKDDKPWTSEKLSKGHQKRFEEKLGKELPKHRDSNNFRFLKIAALFILVFGIGAFFLNRERNIQKETPIVTSPEIKEEQKVLPDKKLQLSDVSPEFRKIENYYIAGINMELAKLVVNNSNKALIDSFMSKMAELNKEYKRLNTEFNEVGANEQTIEAMVQNLQFRLDLLFKLKNKLKEIKQSKNSNYDKSKV